ncbi:hypothetical protein [Mangrovibacterium sp.]|uniref:hypothetical protein n=1 Tax=Mangrovibacterium sp. TaxID=1961364 RepID=UPI003567957C
MAKFHLVYHLHVPALLKVFRFSEIGHANYYFNDHHNELYLNELANSRILPFLRLVHQLGQRSQGKFKMSVSVSGTSLNLFQRYCPEVINELSHLVKQDCLKFLAATYADFIPDGISETVIAGQIKEHRRLIEQLFNQKPSFFRRIPGANRGGLIPVLSDLKLSGIIDPFWKEEIKVSEEQTSVYRKHDFYIIEEDHYIQNAIQRMKRQNPVITDELVAYELMKQLGTENTYSFTLTHDLSSLKQEYLSANFWKMFVDLFSPNPDNRFVTASELVEPNNILLESADCQIKKAVLEAWNDLQLEANDALVNLSRLIQNSLDTHPRMDWRFLLDTEHLQFMSSKFFAEDYSTTHFTPYNSPYEAFTNFMNVVTDLSQKLESCAENKKQTSF